MTNSSGESSADRDLRDLLQEAMRDRFDGVDWEQLDARIVDHAIRARAPVPLTTDVLAQWSGRGALAAGLLIVAGVGALLFVSDPAGADTAPPGFWPVAEELLASVPEDTRMLIEAGADVNGLLRLLAVDAAQEGRPR